jgi:hypothetical protein
MNNQISVIYLFLLMLCSGNGFFRIPAFPGVDGGIFTSVVRGGKVLFVDKLNDKGQGSFRNAIEAEGPGTIIFRVSGNLELAKPISNYYNGIPNVWEKQNKLNPTDPLRREQLYS